MKQEHIDKLRDLLGHVDKAYRIQGLSLLKSFDDYAEVFERCYILSSGELVVGFGKLSPELLEGWCSSNPERWGSLDNISVLGATEPVACAHTVQKYLEPNSKIWVYKELYICAPNFFPWLLLNQTMEHGRIQHGAWNTQGVAKLNGHSAWKQTSDWNILWLRHPCPNASMYTIVVDGYRSEGDRQSHYFRFLSERSGYNDTPIHLSMHNDGNTIKFGSTVPHQLVGGPGELPAIKGQWYSICGIIDPSNLTIEIRINQQLLGVWKLEYYPIATQMSMGSNGVAYQIPADSGWRNLEVSFEPA